MTLTIERATPQDYASVVALLHENHLPDAGLRDHFATALVLRDGDAVWGSAALEVYGDAALLRSVAVSSALRGQGWGRRLTEAAVAQGQAQGVRQLYLLTETAPDFFAHLGFVPITREAAADSVRHSQVDYIE
jgi:amino-acid N-acetyltransferase